MGGASEPVGGGTRRAGPQRPLPVGEAASSNSAVGAAWAFAREHTDVEMPRPYGFKDRGKWHWWDGTTTPAAARLYGPDAHVYVREFFERLFPDMDFTLIDKR